MAPITLTPDQIDDLIYSARAGDLEGLTSDLSSLSTQYSVPQSVIIAAAIDAEPEEEGGSGACLLHYPAANGNLEILTYLLKTLTSTSPAASEPSPSLKYEDIQSVLNHKNHSGNTPLHWAALNTHFECVKVLVAAGADSKIKNEAGLDAVFLAERTDWGVQEDQQGEGQEPEQGEGVEEVEMSVGDADADEAKAGAAPVTKGRQIVEWLLAAEADAEAEKGEDDKEEQK
ncbi:ankyrin repeat-containing domain protein [Aspergillus californicus]